MWISKQEYDEVSPRRNFEVFTLSNEKLTFLEIISKTERSLDRSPKMLLSSRYSSIVRRRWCLVVKQLNKTTLSLFLPYSLEFAPFFLQSFLYVCLFCFAKLNLLAFSSSISLLPLPTFSNTEISLSSPVLLRGCCSRVSSFVSTYPSV